MTTESSFKNAINKISKEISQQVHEHERSLHLVFIPHAPGQRIDALDLTIPHLRQHSAADHIPALLKNLTPDENSGFCGLALHTQRIFFGLLRRTSALGLVTVNTGEFTTAADVRRLLYHDAWHAIALMEARRSPEHRGKFDNGPMIPRRSAANQSLANLQADSFAAVMMSFQKHTNEAKALGKERAKQALEAHYGHDPALFPYAMVAESAHFAITDLAETSIPKSRRVPTALQIAKDIGATTDERVLRQWRAFCVPAQDMAWRGHDPASILGAALHVSEDPYIHSVGYLVAELTGISPLPALDIKKSYNAFADPEINARAHRDAENDAFAEAVAQVVFENNSAPFVAAANAQNRSLAEGRIFGWCAAALQAAARAFDSARANNKSPEQAARDNFDLARKEISWDALDALGAKIIERHRQGHAVTFSGLSNLCAEIPGLSLVSESLTMSMRDPEFSARLEAANALIPAPSLPALARSGPAPRTPAPASQAPVMGPKVPGLGGGRTAPPSGSSRRTSEQQDQS